MSNCLKCGKVLDADDVGAYRKFRDKMATEFLCVPCLSSEMKCTEAFLRERIEFLRENGCNLFVPKQK
jgi:biotin operon repressor